MTNTSHKRDRRVGQLELLLSFLCILLFLPRYAYSQDFGATAERRLLDVLVSDADTDRVTPVRIRFTDSYNQYIPPLGHPYVVEDVQRGADLRTVGTYLDEVKYFAYIDGKCKISLPYGRVLVEVSKGPEYSPLREYLDITRESGKELHLKIRRWIDMPKRGWYGGDDHVHYPSDLQNVHVQMQAEGLHVVNFLAIKGGIDFGARDKAYYWNTEHFTGSLNRYSTPDYQIYVNEEFRHHFLGHLVFFNLKELIWPLSTGRITEVQSAWLASSGQTIENEEVGGYDYPTLAQAADQVHRQGGLVSWAHFDYPNGETAIAIALGGIDAVSLVNKNFGMNPLRIDSVLAWVFKRKYLPVHELSPLEVYYRYLNCGFRIPVSAGTDKMGNSIAVGSARVYAQVQGPFNYETWVGAIRKGRTFFTTGPMIFLTANGKEIGDVIQARESELKNGVYDLRVSAKAGSGAPYLFDRMEIIVNGRIVKSAAAVGGLSATIEETIALKESAWIVARCYQDGQQEPAIAHTSPIYVELPNRPIPPGDAPKLFLQQLDYTRRWIETKGHYERAEDRAKALQELEEARSVYERLIKGN